MFQEQAEADAIMFPDHQEVQAEPHVPAEPVETIRRIKPVVPEIRVHRAIHALAEAIIQPEAPVRLAVLHTADRVEAVAHHTADRAAAAHQEVAAPVLQEVVPEVLTPLHAHQGVIQADAAIQVALQAEAVLLIVADEVVEAEDNHP